MSVNDKNLGPVKGAQSGRTVGKMIQGGKKNGSRTGGGYSGNAVRPSGKARFPNGKYTK